MSATLGQGISVYRTFNVCVRVGISTLGMFTSKLRSPLTEFDSARKHTQTHAPLPSLCSPRIAPPVLHSLTLILSLLLFYFHSHQQLHNNNNTPTSPSINRCLLATSFTTPLPCLTHPTRITRISFKMFFAV